MDVPKGSKKKLNALNVGETVYNVKEVENNNPKLAVYKGENTDITIDYSGKKPKIKLPRQQQAKTLIAQRRV